MIAVDTNVLLRYMLRDDEKQFIASASFFRARTMEDPAFVGLIVLCELTWSLRRRYGFSAQQVSTVIATLFETAEVQIEDEAEVSACLANASAGAEIADALIAYCAARAGCAATVTFDQDAAGRIPGMELLA